MLTALQAPSTSSQGLAACCSRTANRGIWPWKLCLCRVCSVTAWSFLRNTWCWNLPNIAQLHPKATRPVPLLKMERFFQKSLLVQLFLAEHGVESTDFMAHSGLAIHHRCVLTTRKQAHCTLISRHSCFLLKKTQAGT